METQRRSWEFSFMLQVFLPCPLLSSQDQSNNAFLIFEFNSELLILSISCYPKCYDIFTISWMDTYRQRHTQTKQHSLGNTSAVKGSWQFTIAILMFYQERDIISYLILEFQRIKMMVQLSLPQGQLILSQTAISLPWMSCK